MREKFILLFALIFLVVGGCSAKQAISRSANTARQEAQDGKGHLTTAIAEYEHGNDPRPHIVAADDNFDNIIAEADKIHNQLPKTEDKTPWWVLPLCLVVGTIGLVAFLYYFGGPLRSLLYLVIPTSRIKKTEAKLLAEGDVDGVTAAKRQADPRFDYEYQKAKEKAAAK